ncbi:MAG: TetR/AcrR family transcriptional regulator [Parachlamydia sp.]|nr:TetR/AcrR family transcriptional regulator [Parachlamydia sp.]
MSMPKKRAYNSESRKAQSQNTKNRILSVSKELFASKGFEKVTIEEIAQKAEVSSPSIYAIFQSKRGILFALMDEALAPEKFEALVETGKKEKSPGKRLENTSRMTRQLYDAEREQFDLLRGASLLDPVFKELELEKERRRFQRQEEFVQTMYAEKLFKKDLSLERVRDILWAFTGRDLYRMMVIERDWSSNDYEQWLAKLLIETLLKND